jgi:hypothetical protein
LPFSRENIKATSLTIGVVILVMVSITGVLLLARTPNPPPTLYATVTGFPSMVVMQLLQMLRQEHAEKEIVRTRHDLRNELQPLSSAVDLIQMQQGEESTRHVIDRDELRKMIREAVRDSMPGDLHSTIRVVVNEVFATLRRDLNGGGEGAKA